MSIFRCKMCGGTLGINNNETVATCEYCGTKQTLPRLDDDRKANLYDRANHFRRNNEFDKAMGIYEQILNEDNTDAEAYWSIVLCRYGIEYVEDPSTHKRIPTVNRTQFTSIFADGDYKAAIEHADGAQKEIYEHEAKTIDEIQKGIFAISQKEEPFDVFICYKETDNNGRRTPDSVLANDLYHQLTQEGFKVFFARITLEDKLGQEYEPYIFAALNSAKVMVVLGTKPEYFNAVWVKNEWSRYLALIKNGAKKVLVPAYKDMDPYDLPEEFSHLQAQDMSKLGFMQDLIRGIKKLASAEEAKATVKEAVVVGGESGATVAPLLKRAFMFLEDGNWESADEYCEKVLDIDPENAMAYLCKVCARERVCLIEDLYKSDGYFDELNDFEKARRFADNETKAKIDKIIKDRDERVKEEEREEERKMEEEKKLALEKAKELSVKAEKFSDCAVIYDLLKKCRWDKKAEEILSTLSEKEKNLLINAQKYVGSIVSVGFDNIVGLRSDGTVVNVGRNVSEKWDVSDWRDIIAISAGSFNTVGLRSDGTVVAVESFKDLLYGVSDWRDIIAISVGEFNAVGLRSDRTVVAAGSDEVRYGVSDWRDIVAISAGSLNTVGLRSDGTVVAVGDNGYGQCDVSDWRDIVAISAGCAHTVGLRSDGTVVAAGYNNWGQCNVSDWRDIVAISVGDVHTVGLRSDRTVVAAGCNNGGQCDVSGWRDIVAISAGSLNTVGLRSDGTAVAVGSKEYGECDVSGWKLFNDFDEFILQKKAELEEAEYKRAERKEAERLEKMSILEKEKASLEAELPTIKGLFSGGKKAKVEARIAEIEKELQTLK